MSLKNFNERFLISFDSSLIFNFKINMYLLLFFLFVMEKKKKKRKEFNLNLSYKKRYKKGKKITC